MSYRLSWALLVALLAEARPSSASSVVGVLPNHIHWVPRSEAFKLWTPHILNQISVTWVLPTKLDRGNSPPNFTRGNSPPNSAQNRGYSPPDVNRGDSPPKQQQNQHQHQHQHET